MCTSLLDKSYDCLFWSIDFTLRAQRDGHELGNFAIAPQYEPSNDQVLWQNARIILAKEA